MPSSRPAADHQPFLDPEPPPWAARALASLLLVVFAVALVASFVITLPDTVSSAFVLVPGHGADPVRAPRGGTVAAVRVIEGARVDAGAPTFVIRSSTIGDRSDELRALETQLTGAADSRANARQRHESQERADEEEARRLTGRVAHLGEKLAEQRTLREVREARFRNDLAIQENEIDITMKEIDLKRVQHEVAQQLVDRMDLLHRAGSISWLEYNNRRLEAMKLGVEQQQLDRALESARLKVTQLRAQRDTQEIEWKLTVAALQTERNEASSALAKLRQERAARAAEYRELERRHVEESTKARIRAGSLREELAESRGSELTVRAPCAGTVLRLQVNASGAVVQDGDVLAELACGTEALQAEVSLPPTGAGRVKPGQVVRLLYDAFPYQRYGIRYATVRWVSPASVPVKDRNVFRALADVEEQAVRLKEETRPLLAGMGGRADIVVGRRSLISFAFEPIRQLRENIRDRPPAPAPR